MKKFKLIPALLLCMVCILPVFTACGDGSGDGGDKNNGKQVELLVDMHGWMPSVNDTPTIENPNVVNASRVIAAKFMDENPGIKIKWALNKPVGGLEDELGRWFISQIQNDVCPAIAFSWGTRFQDRNYYLDLTEIVAQTNEYAEGAPVWSSMFDDYLWKAGSVMDANDRVVSIPISLFPGPATGMYYNKSLLGTGGGTVAPVPTNWETFVAAAQASKSAGKTGVAPWSFFHAISLDQWVVQHSLGPTFVNAMMKSETYKGIDYNNDGILSTSEQLRAVKAGKFNPTNNEYMKEMLKQAKRYYTDALSKGWDQTDYSNAWTQGTVAMKEEGLWALANENANIGRTFEYGVIPIPFADNTTSPLLSAIEYTEKGPYQPDVDLCLNIMKPAVEGKPEVLAAAVKFLKYLTLPDNIAIMCEEQGASLGAVKGSQDAYSTLIEEWLDQRFPKMEKASWPMAFTGEANSKLNRAFAEWVSGSTGDSTFFAKVNEVQLEGANTYIEKMGINTSGW